MKPVAPAMKILSGTAMVSGLAYSRGTRGRESTDSQAVRRAGQAHQTDLIAEVLIGGNPDPDEIVCQPREETGPMAGLEQDGHRLADEPVIELQALGAGERAEFFAAGLDGRRGDRSGQLGGGRAPTRGVAEHVEIGAGQLGRQRARVGEGRVGFSGKPTMRAVPSPR